MKMQLIPSIAVWVISITSAFAQDLQLAEFIQLTKSESKSERIAGTNRLEIIGKNPKGGVEVF